MRKKPLISLLLIMVIMLTGCSKTYKTKDIKYKVSDDWNCTQNKNGIFCKIVENKAAFSVFNMDTFDDEEGNGYTIDEYIENIPKTMTGLDYEFVLNKNVKIDSHKGKNVIYYTKAKEYEDDIPIINNEHIFKYNKKLYIFSFYTYDDVNADDSDRLYQKYINDYKDIIKSIRIKK